MKEQVDQGVLFGFEHFVCNPTDPQLIRKFPGAWTELPEEECLEAASQSGIQLLKNAWEALTPESLDDRVVADYDARQEEQRQLLWNYWAGIIYLAVSDNRPEGITYLCEKIEEDASYKYTFFEREGDYVSSFQFRFSPKGNTIDWGFHFPVLTAESRKGMYSKDPEYKCVFRKGDFTTFERKSAVFHPENHDDPHIAGRTKIWRTEALIMQRP